MDNVKEGDITRDDFVSNVSSIGIGARSLNIDRSSNDLHASRAQQLVPTTRTQTFYEDKDHMGFSNNII